MQNCYTIHPEAMKLLLPFYHGSDRHYHNFNHIQYCLSKLAEYATNVSTDDQVIDCVKYAIWFHDAIYSPYSMSGNFSNEKYSVGLFLDFLAVHKLYEEWPFGRGFKIENPRKAITDMIIATAQHLTDLPDLPEYTKIMLDVDLVGFSKPIHLVRQDSENIFKEYACLGLSEQEMLINRRKFLKALLARKRIFYTDYFYDQYEDIARNNIQIIIDEAKIKLNSNYGDTLMNNIQPAFNMRQYFSDPN